MYFRAYINANLKILDTCMQLNILQRVRWVEIQIGIVIMTKVDILV